MKRKVFLIFYALILLPLYSKDLYFNGYPTKVQVNGDESFTIMLNNDYDFSFYQLSYNGKFIINKLSGLTKKDICDHTSELNEQFALLCSKDERMLIEIEKEKERQKNLISKKRGIDVSIYAYISFYEKNNERTICLLNIEDGDNIYDSVMITIERDKVNFKTIKKGVVICCFKLDINTNVIVYYNYKKDRTYIVCTRNKK